MSNVLRVLLSLIPTRRTEILKVLDPYKEKVAELFSEGHLHKINIKHNCRVTPINVDRNGTAMQLYEGIRLDESLISPIVHEIKHYRIAALNWGPIKRSNNKDIYSYGIGGIFGTKTPLNSVTIDRVSKMSGLEFENNSILQEDDNSLLTTRVTVEDGNVYFLIARKRMFREV